MIEKDSKWTSYRVLCFSSKQKYLFFTASASAVLVLGLRIRFVRYGLQYTKLIDMPKLIFKIKQITQNCGYFFVLLYR